jgi:hypothetical protein
MGVSVGTGVGAAGSAVGVGVHVAGWLAMASETGVSSAVPQPLMIMAARSRMRSRKGRFDIVRG